MSEKNYFHIWNKLSRLIDDARGFALLADLDCSDSIDDKQLRENSNRALISATRLLVDQAADLMSELEPVCK